MSKSTCARLIFILGLLDRQNSASTTVAAAPSSVSQASDYRSTQAYASARLGPESVPRPNVLAWCRVHCGELGRFLADPAAELPDIEPVDPAIGALPDTADPAGNDPAIPDLAAPEAPAEDLALPEAPNEGVTGEAPATDDFDQAPVDDGGGGFVDDGGGDG